MTDLEICRTAFEVLEPIPADKWWVGNLTGPNGSHCALGHLYQHEKNVTQPIGLAHALPTIFAKHGFGGVAEVNDMGLSETVFFTPYNDRVKMVSHRELLADAKCRVLRALTKIIERLEFQENERRQQVVKEVVALSVDSAKEIRAQVLEVIDKAKTNELVNV